jgi:hypothetical protein
MQAFFGEDFLLAQRNGQARNSIKPLHQIIVIYNLYCVLPTDSNGSVRYQ